MFDRIRVLFEEPSTYAGLAAILGGVGVFAISTATWMEVFGAITVVLGAAAAVMRDRADVDD